MDMVPGEMYLEKEVKVTTTIDIRKKKNNGRKEVRRRDHRY